jgi:hypothetical protein
MSVEQRERYLWQVYEREMKPFRATKEQNWLDCMKLVRGVDDKASLYRASLQHPYAFSAVEAIKAAIYPVLFSSDPVVQIIDPNQDNQERNRLSEKLLTGLVNNPQWTNFKTALDRIISDAIVFGFSSTWNYFKSQTVKAGPIFEAVELTDGTFASDEQGEILTQETYVPLRLYHAPWIEHISVFDTYLHPDGIRGFSIRDVSGHELLRQSQGMNPIYDFVKVNRMLVLEMSSSKSQSTEGGGFSSGEEDRDALINEVGVETGRHEEMRGSLFKDAADKTYEVFHYDDGIYSGSYARKSGNGFFELRFFPGASADGMGNRISMVSNYTPGEVYGTSIVEQNLSLLIAQTRFYRAMLDGAALTVHPMWVVSETMRRRHPELSTGPGAIWQAPVTPGDRVENHVQRLDMPQAWMNSFQVVDGIQKGLDMSFALDNPQRGQFAGGRKTAFETNQVLQGSSRRIEMIHQRMVDQFAVPLFRKWLAMAKIHYTREDFTKILGPENVNYEPPELDEIVGTLSYMPKGSILASDTETRAARWPAILSMAVEHLPFMQFPHIHEMWKRALEDFGMDGVAHILPPKINPEATEYQQLVALSGAGQQGGIGSPPASPGGFSDQLSAVGGETAPPGPVSNVPIPGGGNGASRF